MSSMSYHAMLTVAALVFLVYLGTLLRGHRIRMRYAYLWGTLGLGVLVLALWPGLAVKAAALAGFETAANMLLAIAAFVLLMAVMSLSTAVSSLERRQERLVEEIALLEQRLREVEKNREDAGQ